MLALSFQKKSLEERLSIVLEVSNALKLIDDSKYPTISRMIKVGNAKKVAIINSVITQMESLELDVESSILAVEENI